MVDFDVIPEAELLELAATKGVTLEARADGGTNVLGIGGGIWYGERRLAVSYLRDWMRRAT